ncbi:tail completion protein gp17 [Metasolibacillus meyeri]|uniref:tail completion protein gp17 n=1 Tax=Metasolibacillus meyeri TaxID=1071052 RepID=UPI000D3035CD|nr:DUF3168 domain-containing protein [Metasolibacillus meyeri]
MSVIIALQTAIVQRLSEDSDLLALIPIDLMAEEEKDRRLYDYIPNEALSPYIHVSAPTISRVLAGPDLLQDISVTLHIWHNQEQTGEYGNYMPALFLNAVKQALRFKLNIVDFEITKVDIDDERIFEDINAVVKHAVLSLTYRLFKRKV